MVSYVCVRNMTKLAILFQSDCTVWQHCLYVNLVQSVLNSVDLDAFVESFDLRE